jgi:hypothetical protein
MSDDGANETEEEGQEPADGQSGGQQQGQTEQGGRAQADGQDAGQPQTDGEDQGQPAPSGQPQGQPPMDGQQGPAQGGQGQPAPGGQAQGQPSQGGQVPPAGGQGQQGQAPAGQVPQQTGPSLVDKLQREPVLSELKAMVGLYGVVAVGLTVLSLFPLLVSNQTDGSGTIAHLAALFLGVGLAAVLGTRFGERVQADQQAVGAAAAVASGVGTFAIATFTFVVVIITAGSYAEVGPLFLGLFFGSIVAAVVGGAAAVLPGLVAEV